MSFFKKHHLVGKGTSVLVYAAALALLGCNWYYSYKMMSVGMSDDKFQVYGFTVDPALVVSGSLNVGQAVIMEIIMDSSKFREWLSEGKGSPLDLAVIMSRSIFGLILFGLFSFDIISTYSQLTFPTVLGIPIFTFTITLVLVFGTEIFLALAHKQWQMSNGGAGTRKMPNQQQAPSQGFPKGGGFNPPGAKAKSSAEYRDVDFL